MPHSKSGPRPIALESYRHHHDCDYYQNLARASPCLPSALEDAKAWGVGRPGLSRLTMGARALLGHLL